MGFECFRRLELRQQRQEQQHEEGEESGRRRGRGPERGAGSTLQCMACIFCLPLAKSWSLALFSSTFASAPDSAAIVAIASGRKRKSK